MKSTAVNGDDAGDLAQPLDDVLQLGQAVDGDGGGNKGIAAPPLLPGVEGVNKDLHIGELLGHVGQQTRPVHCQDVQGGLKIILHIAGPVSVDPPLWLGTLGQVPGYVGAAALVDGDPKAPG